MKNAFLFVLVAFLLSGYELHAQKFLPSMERFSGSKPGYLVLQTGERVDLTVRRLKRKKGGIRWIKGRTLEGDKFKYRATDLKELAMAPTNLSKFNATMEVTETALAATRTDLEGLNRGLVYHYPEYAKKNRKKMSMMQLLNPDFCGKVRVYDDAGAGETRGIAVQGMNVTGGIKKAYYVKHEGKLAHIKKGQYRKLFKQYFGDCPELLAAYPKPAWRDFAEHLHAYEQRCAAADKKAVSRLDD